MSYPVDLHSHTTRSDGRDTPAELLQNAARRGVRVLAITDHDIRPPPMVEVDGRALAAVEYARALGVELIPGIEISCDAENEDVHIVALGCDWSDSWFEALEKDTVKSKLEGYQKTCGALCQTGMALTFEEVLENAGILEAPEKVQKKHIFEMIAKKGYTKTWNDAKILLQVNSSLNFKRAKPCPEDVIHAVHRAGGLAILAHPYLIDDPAARHGMPVSRHSYLLRLADCGLDGIEARYTYDKTSYKGAMTKEEIYGQVMARYPLSVISGGSDYHADCKSGAKRCRELGEAGLTEAEFYGNSRLAALLTTVASASEADCDRKNPAP